MFKKYYKAVQGSAEKCEIRKCVPTGKTGQILKHMQTGRSITSIEAFTLYNETRLSAVIFNLKKYGYKIGDKWLETKCGDRYKAYYLED